MSDSIEESLPVGLATDEEFASTEPVDSRRLRRARREAAEASLARGFMDPAARPASPRAERFGVVFSDQGGRSPRF